MHSLYGSALGSAVEFLIRFPHESFGTRTGRGLFSFRVCSWPSVGVQTGAVYGQLHGQEAIVWIDAINIRPVSGAREVAG